MFRFKSFRISSVSVITTLVLLMAGCGSGGSSSGSTTLTIPADAVEINAGNAEAVARAALDSGNNLGSATAREAGTQISIQDAIDIATGHILNRDLSSRSVVTSASVSQTYSCDSGGTVTYNFNSTASTETGSVSFYYCNILGEIIINGSYFYSLSFIDPIFSFDANGNLSFEIVANGTTLTMAMVISQTINFATGDFSYSQNYSVTGLPMGGFLVTTTIPFEGNYSTGVEKGQLLIEGANNSKIRVTVIATNTARIEVDDGTGAGFVIVTESFPL